MNKKPLIIIAGPTAVGKTRSSVELAKKIGGEIISADSMQVYRRMDIGSAKVTPEEMQQIPHYLIDVLDPKEPFNVTVFQKLAREALEKIYAKGHIPIVVGGTGFYIQALLYDIDFTAEAENREVRERLEQEAKDLGPEALFERLKALDPESAEAIPMQNVKRVIRALEYFELTGEKISVHNSLQREKESPYDFRYFVLTMDREKLYERIERRVDLMMEQGLLSEVQALREEGCTGNMTSMQGLGYRQLLQYLQGQGTLEEAVERIKEETRHFAKRQLTWFKREKEVIYVNVEKENLLDVYEIRHF